MRRSGYSVLRWLLLMAVGTSAQSAIAQPLSQSHRILELPQSGMSDLQQQMQMLRQLQSLVGDQKNPTSESSGIDLEQLNQLQQMIQRFGGDLPQNMLPMLNNIPPNVMRDTLADPKARQQIQQMLQQYAKDHQLPRGALNSNMPLLPPSKGNRPQNRATGNPPSSSQQKQGPPKQGSDVSRSDEVLQKAWEGMTKKFSDFQQRANGTTEPLPNHGPAGDENPQNSWNDVLDRLIAEERKLREGDDGNTADINDERPGNALSANRPSNGTSERTSTNSQSKTVAEYLQELKNQTTPRVETRPRTSPQRPRSANQSNGTSGQPSSAPVESTAAREQLKQDTKSSLQQRGITETLRKIAKDARQQVRASGSSPGNTTNESRTGAQSGESSGLERSLIRALDGLRKDIVEIAKDAKFKPVRSDTAPQATGRPGADGSDSGLQSISRSAGNFLNDLTSTPASASGPSSSTPVSINETVTENIFGLLTLLLLVGVVALYAWKSGLFATPVGESVRVVPVRADEIQTREDVVNAFHKMALQPSRPAQQWWTHRKVADQLFQDRPEHVHAVEVLAELYEQARYLPAESAFSQEQIQSARRALTQCESC